MTLIPIHHHAQVIHINGRVLAYRRRRHLRTVLAEWAIGAVVIVGGLIALVLLALILFVSSIGFLTLLRGALSLVRS